MLLLGIDIGTSSVKVAVVDAATQQVITSTQYPDTETPIIAVNPGWAEQDPEMWWRHVQKAVRICNNTGLFDPKDISAIGIGYQMHGLVLVDKDQNVLRNSIIWCDSRAVALGDDAFNAIGHEKCLSRLLNSPGNFTASKLAWVKANEPQLYERIDKVMLPGDFIAMKLTGEITTSVSALSEGIFFDYQTGNISMDVTGYFNFDSSLFPSVHPVFSAHGGLSRSVAEQLNLKPGTPVSYKSGDQPNNALSLNVMQPGEVAATAGTSGVIYGVSDQLTYDKRSRVNTFAHVNYTDQQKRLGMLLCINGVGSMYRWMKNILGDKTSYPELNSAASQAPEGSGGLRILPFGNGAERMLNNKITGAAILNIDVNLHTTAHMIRAAQEGIAFAFRYGLDIMRENDMSPTVIRAGKNNLFLSDLFTQTFVNTTGVQVELYKNDGSAGIGAGIFLSPSDAFRHFHPVKTITPQKNQLEPAYQDWKFLLEKVMERAH